MISSLLTDESNIEGNRNQIACVQIVTLLPLSCHPQLAPIFPKLFLPDCFRGFTVTIQLLAVLKIAIHSKLLLPKTPTRPMFRSTSAARVLWPQTHYTHNGNLILVSLLDKGPTTVYCISIVILYWVISSQWSLC